MNKKDTELFICECGCMDHQFIVITSDDWDDGDLFIEMKLNKERSIFKRIWIALNYIFGKPCRYGDFDEVILNPENQYRLMKILEDHLRLSKK